MFEVVEIGVNAIYSKLHLFKINFQISAYYLLRKECELLDEYAKTMHLHSNDKTIIMIGMMRRQFHNF